MRPRARARGPCKLINTLHHVHVRDCASHVTTNATRDMRHTLQRCGRCIQLCPVVVLTRAHRVVHSWRVPLRWRTLYIIEYVESGACACAKPRIRAHRCLRTCMRTAPVRDATDRANHVAAPKNVSPVITTPCKTLVFGPSREYGCTRFTQQCRVTTSWRHTLHDETQQLIESMVDMVRGDLKEERIVLRAVLVSVAR